MTTRYDIYEDYTDIEQQDAIILRNQLLAKDQSVNWSRTELNTMANALLEVLQQLYDYPSMNADNIFTYRHATRLSGGIYEYKYPEFRHEFLMHTDRYYFAAWSYANSTEFAARANSDTALMAEVTQGQANYPDTSTTGNEFLEWDTTVVERSKLRWQYREPAEGEATPPVVFGDGMPDPPVYTRY